MKNEKWVLLLLLLIVALLIGYSTGRRFPVRQYERLNDEVLFDPDTGKACVAFITGASEVHIRAVYDEPVRPLPACPK